MHKFDEKCWGSTACTDHHDMFSRHELVIQKGGYCSVHLHQYRINHFEIISGIVDVVCMFGPSLRKVRLNSDPDGKGQRSCYILPMVAHQFQVIEGGSMVEVYTPGYCDEIDIDDIHRFTTGGKLNCIPTDMENEPFFLDTVGNKWQFGDGDLK